MRATPIGGTCPCCCCGVATPDNFYRLLLYVSTASTDTPAYTSATSVALVLCLGAVCPFPARTDRNVRTPLCATLQRERGDFVGVCGAAVPPLHPRVGGVPNASNVLVLPRQHARHPSYGGQLLQATASGATVSVTAACATVPGAVGLHRWLTGDLACTHCPHAPYVRHSRARVHGGRRHGQHRGSVTAE